MIGVLRGIVLFSDGKEAIIQTQSGVGYQIFCHHILPEGGESSLFISHVVRETAELLFAFKDLRSKKFFEVLMTVKGVGPKSAYAIICGLSVNHLIEAVLGENKKVLMKIKGVGAKAASQIILDLQKTVQKIKMYSSVPLGQFLEVEHVSDPIKITLKEKGVDIDTSKEITTVKTEEILGDTLLACEGLGFHAETVIPLAQRILKENSIKKTEQLIHLVLKEI